METPDISASAYITNTYNPFAAQLAAVVPGLAQQEPVASKRRAQEIIDRFNRKDATEAYSMRIVKVLIADPNENLALADRLLYSGEEKLTDLTDQELYFELNIGELLVKHNAKRAKTLHKAQTEKFGRNVFLEPARIRDLKMVVVEIAKF